MEEEVLSKSAHKVFKIKYHFVFCIKYGKDLFLDNQYVETIKQLCKGFEDRYHMRFETIGFDEDHVHFMLQSVLKYSPSQIFRLVKSITAIELFKKHSDLKKQLWGGELGDVLNQVYNLDKHVNRDTAIFKGVILYKEKGRYLLRE